VYRQSHGVTPMLLHSSVITALAWSLMHQLPTHGACSSVTGLLKPMQTVKSHLGHCPVARIAVPHFRVPTGVRPVYSGMTVTEAATAETKPVTLVSFGGSLLSRAGKPRACHSSPPYPRTLFTYLFGGSSQSNGHLFMHTA